MIILKKRVLYFVTSFYVCKEFPPVLLKKYINKDTPFIFILWPQLRKKYFTMWCDSELGGVTPSICADTYDYTILPCLLFVTCCYLVNKPFSLHIITYIIIVNRVNYTRLQNRLLHNKSMSIY